MTKTCTIKLASLIANQYVKTVEGILTPNWAVKVVEVRRYSHKVSFDTQLKLARVVGGNSYKVAEVLHAVNNVPQDSQCRHVYTGLYTHEYKHNHVTTTMLFQKFSVCENAVTNTTCLKLTIG